MELELCTAGSTQHSTTHNRSAPPLAYVSQTSSDSDIAKAISACLLLVG